MENLTGQYISAVGWQKTLARQNMTVTITPEIGAPVTYLPGDTRVRGVVNLYPDPRSNLVVDDMTNPTTVAGGLASSIKGNVTNNDNEWWQTTVMMDLPTVLEGIATINIVDSQGAVINPISIEILPGTSASNKFPIYMPWGTTPANFLSLIPNVVHTMERAPSSTVTFSGSTMPHSIQMSFSHTPDIGKAWVINPRGDIKNVIWSDDGTNLKVMVTPPDGKTLVNAIDLKFYIAGGVTGLTQTSLKAYDINGSPITGVTATVTAQ